MIDFRLATERDLERIVALLADDPLGATRENPGPPLPDSYRSAYAEIAADPNNEIWLAMRDGLVIGVLQLTIIPTLTHGGSRRALIEGVRVATQARGAGVGAQMIEAAVGRARQRGCAMVQLTSDKRRPDAIRFYERLGFSASHEGFKRWF
ncbi:MAG: GNAT family N-acetyltransferase [Burkholderiaceae bacterium]